MAQFKPFDAIMLVGIIHHMDDAKAEDLFGLLAKCLAPNGRVVTLDPCLTPTQSRIACWFVSNVCRIPSTELIMRLGRPHEPKVI